MTSELRFVFDTNALVNAFLARRSASRQALEEALASGTLLVSAAAVQELTEVLHRPRFSRYASMEVRGAFVAALERQTVAVDIVERVVACRDPKDDLFLEVAVNGRAACIVTGDQDLLVLHPFRGIPILTPRDFLDRSWGEG